MPNSDNFTFKTKENHYSLVFIPSFEITLHAKKFLTSNFIAPGAYNPHNIKPFYIGYQSGFEFTDLCVVWAQSETEALDCAVDSDMLDHLLFTDPIPENLTEDEYQEFLEEKELFHLGNAGELFACSNVKVLEIELNTDLLIKYIRAEERALDNLDFLD